jgi:hypothetical protein
MWEQISEFLFDNYAVGGFQFENWTWVIGVPALLTFGYFFERGFGRKTGDTPGIHPVDNPRGAPARVLGSQAGSGPAQMQVWLQENSQRLILGFFAGGVLLVALNTGFGWLTAGSLVAALVVLTITRRKRGNGRW